MQYSPWVSSPYSIVYSEAGHSSITKHPDKEFCDSMLQLLSLPIKNYTENNVHDGALKSICGINKHHVGRHIDVVAMVLYVSDVKTVQITNNINNSFIEVRCYDGR